MVNQRRSIACQTALAPGGADKPGGGADGCSAETAGATELPGEAVLFFMALGSSGIIGEFSLWARSTA